MLLTTKDLPQRGLWLEWRPGRFFGAKFIIPMNNTDEVQGWVKFWSGKTVVIYEMAGANDNKTGRVIEDLGGQTVQHPFLGNLPSCFLLGN